MAKRTKEELRQELVDSQTELKAKQEAHRKKCGEAMEMIQDEPDREKQIELLNFLFEGGIEEVIEYYIRHTVLKIPKK